MTKRNILFISHASPEDNVFTTWLGAKLSAAGYEVWADVFKLVGGDDWQQKLENAIRDRAVKVLMVGTQTGARKRGVRNEIQIADQVSKRISDNEFIIPLRLEDFDAPFLIAHAQYINFGNSWAEGLKELLETLVTYNVPKVAAESLDMWRAVQLTHGKSPVMIEEKLVSNWLKFQSLPAEMRFYDFNAGISIGYKEAAVKSLRIPVISQNRGFITFADYPSLQEALGPELPIQQKEVCKTEDFLENGWPALNITRQVARNSVSNMLRQGIESVFAAKSMSSYEMSSRKFCWFGVKDITPDSQIRFGWPNGVAGRRQILGYSPKRKLHWHYCTSPQVTMWPEPHIKLRGGLVFSEDGIKPIDNPKKMHSLRRSFTKSWRNARWRDMLLAILHWITDGAETLIIPFGEEKGAVLSIPTITFTSPVSMPVEIEADEPEDEEDPDETEEPFAAADLDSIAEIGDEEVEA
jgi:hypothetical protein